MDTPTRITETTATTTNLNDWQSILANKITSTEMLIIGVILLVVYLIQHSNGTAKYKASLIKFHNSIRDIQSRYKKELRNFIRAKMDYIIFNSGKAARSIIDTTDSPCTGSGCIIDPLRVQLGAYKDRVELTIRGYLQDAVFGCIYTNGFTNMSDVERDIYFAETGEHLWNEVHERVAIYEENFPTILAHPEYRFSKEDGIRIYKDIIMKYLRLQELEKAEVTQLQLEMERLEKENTIRYKVCKINPFCKKDK